MLLLFKHCPVASTAATSTRVTATSGVQLYQRQCGQGQHHLCGYPRDCRRTDPPHASSCGLAADDSSSLRRQESATRQNTKMHVSSTRNLQQATVNRQLRLAGLIRRARNVPGQKVAAIRNSRIRPPSDVAATALVPFDTVKRVAVGRGGMSRHPTPHPPRYQRATVFGQRRGDGVGDGDDAPRNRERTRTHAPSDTRTCSYHEWYTHLFGRAN